MRVGFGVGIPVEVDVGIGIGEVEVSTTMIGWGLHETWSRTASNIIENLLSFIDLT
jgi:hypothetical protein